MATEETSPSSWSPSETSSRRVYPAASSSTTPMYISLVVRFSIIVIIVVVGGGWWTVQIEISLRPWCRPPALRWTVNLRRWA